LHPLATPDNHDALLMSDSELWSTLQHEYYHSRVNQRRRHLLPGVIGAIWKVHVQAIHLFDEDKEAFRVSSVEMSPDQIEFETNLQSQFRHDLYETDFLGMFFGLISFVLIFGFHNQEKNRHVLQTGA
jgi:hypothetical protein